MLEDHLKAFFPGTLYWSMLLDTYLNALSCSNLLNGEGFPPTTDVKNHQALFFRRKTLMK